jgi:helicase MOV-10
LLGTQTQLLFICSFSAGRLGKSKWIHHDQRSTIMVSFRASHEGHFDDTLELTFEHFQTSQRFVIIRRLHAIVGSNDDRDTLKPSAPYTKRKSIRIPLEGEIISELRPSTWSETKWAVFLPIYKIPRDLIKVANSRNGLKLVKTKFMPASFSEKTYGRHFQVMLHIEEDQRTSVIDMVFSQITTNERCYVVSLQ